MRGVVGNLENRDWLYIGFLAIVSVERLWETRASRRAERGQKQQGWSLPLLYILHILILVAVATEYFLIHRPLQWWVSGGGAVLVVAALTLRLAAIRTLGRFWSLHVEIRAEHRLVWEGPYRFVRHPAYAAVVVEFIGLPLVGNCYYSLLPVVLIYFPVLAARIAGEEQALVAKFGDAYVRYQAAVGALIPRFPSRTGRRG